MLNIRYASVFLITMIPPWIVPGVWSSQDIPGCFERLYDFLMIETVLLLIYIYKIGGLIIEKKSFQPLCL